MHSFTFYFLLFILQIKHSWFLSKLFVFFSSFIFPNFIFKTFPWINFTIFIFKTSFVFRQKCDESLTSLQTELTSFVRKQFASTLQGLMQHGLHEKRNTTTTLMPFIGCIIPFNQIASQREESYYDDGQDMHVWQFVLEYYHLKKGDQYNETPIRKLSESFNLNISEPTPRSSSAKHSLLKAIGTIIGMHAPYKRSYNSHFKAFVSAGLKWELIRNTMNRIYSNKISFHSFSILVSARKNYRPGWVWFISARSSFASIIPMIVMYRRLAFVMHYDPLTVCRNIHSICRLIWPFDSSKVSQTSSNKDFQ